MLHSKILLITGAEVFFIAFMVSYFNVEIPLPKLWPDRPKEQPAGPGSAKSRPVGHPVEEGGSDEFFEELPAKPVIFTPRELAQYDGSKKSKGLYLAILGKVYDVKKGSKHYGPRGGYHFFAGKDATRAFVTGEFTDSGLTTDISGLTHQDMLGIEEWLSFYDKQYAFVGYVSGVYYDSAGYPTKKLTAAMEATEEAHRWRQEQSSEAARFPPCNSEWNPSKGGRVWCTNKSGGIARDWVGVPRKLFRPGSSKSRCACVKNTGPPQDAEPDAPRHADVGDLENPNLQKYSDCNDDAISCSLPPEE